MEMVYSVGDLKGKAYLFYGLSFIMGGGGVNNKCLNILQKYCISIYWLVFSPSGSDIYCNILTQKLVKTKVYAVYLLKSSIALIDGSSKNEK